MAKLIVIAEEQERKLVEQYLPDLPVLVTGVGALNIFRALRNIPLDTEIINIGYAGSANFEIGSLVEVTQSCLNHPNVQYPEPEFYLKQLPTDLRAQLPITTKAICYSGVDFVLQSDYKDCVFDMELAFICAMGFSTVYALKYVSDNLSLHEYRQTGGEGV